MNLARRNLFGKVFGRAVHQITDLIIRGRVQCRLDSNESGLRASPEQVGLALANRKKDRSLLKKSRRKEVVDSTEHEEDI